MGEGKPRFNPTLVRLRPPFRYIGPTILPSFNPTLVRLRPDLRATLFLEVDVFQSHAGSIEAVRPTIGRER